MAYNARNINPLDLRPSTAIGVSIPFSAPQVFTSTYTTQDQLKYNIINFLLTGRRERVFQPTFGAGLREQLFEQITTESAATIELIIKEGVQTYFPNVTVTTLQVIPIEDENTINIVFSYNIVNTGQTDQIILNFDNG
jgi:phage baseplate assembly protein W